MKFIINLQSNRFSTEYSLLDSETNGLNSTTWSSSWVEDTTAENSIQPQNEPAEKILGWFVAAVTLYLAAVTLWYQARHSQMSLQKTNYLCTFTVLTLVVRITAVKILLYGGHISNTLCNVAVAFSYVSFGFSRFLPYVVLWLRQHAIYKNINYDSQEKRRIQIMARIVLAGIIIFQPALTTLQIIFTRFVASPFGCILEDKEMFFSFLQKASPIFFGASAFFQVLLLGLVLFPFYQHIKGKKFREKGIRKTLIRLALCTSICIASDLIFLLAKQFQPRTVSSLLTALFSCCDNIINVASMLGSFADFRLRLFPMIPKTRRKPEFSQSAKKQSSTQNTADSHIKAIKYKLSQDSI